jgi:hypothetical protein
MQKKVIFVSALCFFAAFLMPTPNVLHAQTEDPFKQMERMMRLMEQRMQQSMRSFDDLMNGRGGGGMLKDTTYSFSDTITSGDGSVRMFRFFSDGFRPDSLGGGQGMDSFFRRFFDMAEGLGDDLGDEEMPADDGANPSDILPEERMRQREEKQKSKEEEDMGIKEVKPKQPSKAKQPKTYRL